MPRGARPVAVDVVVAAAVGEQLPRPPPRSRSPSPDRRHRLDRRDELGDVVAVAAGQRHRQRNAGGVDDQVVLGAGAAAGPATGRPGPPFGRADVGAVDRAPVQVQLAGGAQLGQQQLVQRRSHAGLGQSRSRRQQVTPEQPASAVGSWFQVRPVFGTNTLPASAARSSIGRRPESDAGVARAVAAAERSAPTARQARVPRSPSTASTGTGQPAQEARRRSFTQRT